MDIVSFLDKQFKRYNEQEKCGLCWNFYAPLAEKEINVQKLNDNCCVNVFFIQDQVVPFETAISYDENRLINFRDCRRSFQLLFLTTSTLGTQNYTEINSEKETSRWTTILQPLEACLSCDFNFDFCDILEQDYEITQWSARQVLNYKDENFAGYRLSITINKRIYE